MESQRSGSAVPTRWVRVWYGSYVVADYRADPLTTQRYMAAMRRRLAGLRITDDPLAASDKSPPSITLPPGAW